MQIKRDLETVQIEMNLAPMLTETSLAPAWSETSLGLIRRKGTLAPMLISGPALVRIKMIPAPG